MKQNLAEALKKLRFDKYSQEEVAKKIGVSLSTYSRMERMEAEIDLPVLLKIADLYKITVDELIHYDDPDFKVEEPKVAYQKRWSVPIMVTLDGTAETLEKWVNKLTSINSAI